MACTITMTLLKEHERNANFEFSLYEALEEIDVLQAELNNVKVVGLERGRKS